MTVLFVTGCSAVKISFQNSDDYVTNTRSDYINTGNLSRQTVTALHVMGLEEDACKKDRRTCITALTESQALNKEQRLSSTAELWLMDAIIRNKKLPSRVHFNGKDEAFVQTLSSYFEAARAASAYLFYTDRSLDTRALEARQHQVRDIYNYATYTSITILSDAIKRYRSRQHITGTPPESIAIGNWSVSLDLDGMQEPEDENTELDSFTPDYRLNFAGIRNQYTQDGLGARMVLTMATHKKSVEQNTASNGQQQVESIPEEPSRTSFLGHRHKHRKKSAEKQFWEPMQYVAVTALLKFPGNNLNEVLKTNRVILSAYDTWQPHDVHIAGHSVPLAANYTAAYGLWLANSDFSSQSIGTLFGRGNILEEPRVYLLHPYQPNLKTLILVHGLASSPEAWVNTANEIMGDDELRQNYQIWQVYYPTSAPIGINRYDIANAIEKTFDHYDPQRKNPASHDVVIMGHSMGGILSRLLVSNSEDTIWEDLNKFHKIDDDKKEKVKSKIGKYIFFKPLPEISRAVFIAAPHRGTPFADKSIARFVASLVKMPITVLHKVTDTAATIFGASTPDRKNFNGVDNLSAKDPAIQSAAKLKISPDVRFHSIMGNDTPDLPRAESSDGIVPYSSSHWDGALSEVVIPSGHSVQETPQAIIEIRRILHEHLNELNKKH